jgi:hypothetical protein
MFRLLGQLPPGDPDFERGLLRWPGRAFLSANFCRTRWARAALGQGENFRVIRLKKVPDVHGFRFRGVGPANAAPHSLFLFPVKNGQAVTEGK